MVEIADIKDRNSLRDWLQDQPQLVSTWMAHRIAMRVLPTWWLYALKTFATNKRELNALPVFYANLVSGVASNIPTSDISLAATNATNAAHSVGEDNADNAAGAFAASSAANTVTSDAESAATHAVYAAANAAYAAANSWKLIRADCEAIKEGVDLDHRPLWGAQKNQLENVWGVVRQQLSALSSSRSGGTARASTDWSFWIKWYDDALAGTPPNWKMLERIALIDPKDWDKGAEVVNLLIAEIEKEFSVQATPYAEDIIYDGQYHSQPRSDLPAQTLGDARARIGDVVEALRKVGNQYPSLGDEADFLARMLERYPERAIRLFEACQKVIIHMGNHQGAGDVPLDGNLVGDVIGDLQNTADDIYSFDPEVQQVSDARDARRFERLSETQREDVARVAEAVALHSDDDLAEELREDAVEVSGEDDPEGETKPARYRLGSRLVRVWKLAGEGLKNVSAALIFVGGLGGGASAFWDLIKFLIGF